MWPSARARAATRRGAGLDDDGADSPVDATTIRDALLLQRGRNDARGRRRVRTIPAHDGVLRGLVVAGEAVAGAVLHLSGLEAEWHRRAAACADVDAVAAAFDACVAEWGPALRTRLDAEYAEMTDLLAALSPEERARSLALHRRLVQPLFLASPFCRRAIDKPLGYPGDFGLVEMIFTGREESQTPLGALLGAYALGVGPSAA